jgi:hypothetical protein
MPNKDHIKDVEAYLAQLQTLEINIQKPGVIDDIIMGYMTKEAIYESIRELESLRKDLEDVLLRLTKKSGDTGKLMAQKAMDRFLEKSEMRDLTQRQLRLINKLNARQIEKRIDFYTAQIKAETGALASDINLFFKSAAASGRTRADALKDLVKAANDDAGIIKGFEKRVKRVASDAVRREAQMRAVEEYRKVAKPGEKWQWITVSTAPCPDCQARAGVMLSWDAWVSMGMPGSGRTICGNSCKCQLVPGTVADEQFPDAKQFDWDREKLVLTTAGEARSLAAKSNQP